MSQRRYKPYLRDNFQKHMVQIKSQWSQTDQVSHLPSGNFYPVHSKLTELLRDDDTSTLLPGEKLTLSLNDVHYVWPGLCDFRTTGTLQVTTYRLIFVADQQQPANPNPYSTDPVIQKTSGKTAEAIPLYRPIPHDICVPLYAIEKVEYDPKQKVSTPTPSSPVMYIDITCKDVREYRFGLPQLAEGGRAVNLLSSFAFDTIPHHIYPFTLPRGAFYLGVGPNPAQAAPIENTKAVFPFVPNAASISVCIPPHLDGWRFYNPTAEYGRMGIPNENFQISKINENYDLCPSYPNTLVTPQPEHMTETEYRQGAKFRSKNRVPALTWKNPGGYQTIWRCSQPATGISFNRSAEDEKLLEFIGKSNKYNQNLTIVDCRPRANAYANNIRGFGFETEANYPTAQLKFMNIENIHEVRKSFKRLRKACISQRYDQTFPSELQQSLWLKHIQDILRATAQVVKIIDAEGQSVLIRCSDGWDRTAQLCSLSKLCLDPYYRTIRGFCTLIDHDWLSFGHKFHDRYGHFQKDIKEERSPIFVQFLDCVAQLLMQFPRHFEFNSEFLVQIALHSFSSRFGTFLLNTEKERQFFKIKRDQPSQRIADISISLWTYLFCCPAAVRGDFINAFYSPGGQGDPMDLIKPEHQAIIPPSFYIPDNIPLPGSEIEGQLRFLQTEPLEGSLGTGSVLYPSFNAMKLTVWADYWYKHHFDLSNEFFHYSSPGTTGNIFPGGATTSALKSPLALFNSHFQWSQLISGSLALRAAPQQHILRQLQQHQTSTDANMVKLVQLLAEKDAMLQYYQTKYGPIDPTEHEKLISIATQQHEEQRAAVLSQQQETQFAVMSPQEENAFYIQQQQQYLVHRTSYCANLNSVHHQQQHSEPQQTLPPTIEYDPLAGVSFMSGGPVTPRAPQPAPTTTPAPPTSPTPTVPMRPKRPAPETPTRTLQASQQQQQRDMVSTIPPPPSSTPEDPAPPVNHSPVLVNTNYDHAEEDEDDGDDDSQAVDFQIGAGDDDDDDDVEQMEASANERNHALLNLSQFLVKKQQQAVVPDNEEEEDHYHDDGDGDDDDDDGFLSWANTDITGRPTICQPPTPTHQSTLASQPQQVASVPAPATVPVSTAPTPAPVPAPTTTLQQSLSSSAKKFDALINPGGLLSPTGATPQSLFDLEDEDQSNASGFHVNNVFGHKHDIFSSGSTTVVKPQAAALHFEDEHDDDDDDDELCSSDQSTPIAQCATSTPQPCSMKSMEVPSPSGLEFDPMAMYDGEYDEEDQE